MPCCGIIETVDASRLIRAKPFFGRLNLPLAKADSCWGKMWVDVRRTSAGLGIPGRTASFDLPSAPSDARLLLSVDARTPQCTSSVLEVAYQPACEDVKFWPCGGWSTQAWFRSRSQAHPATFLDLPRVKADAHHIKRRFPGKNVGGR
jgi:hypothetical protein